MTRASHIYGEFVNPKPLSHSQSLALHQPALVLFGDAKGFVGNIVRELTGGGH